MRASSSTTWPTRCRCWATTTSRVWWCSGSGWASSTTAAGAGPCPSEGDTFTLDVDVVIPAIGQTTDTSWMQTSRHQGQPVQHVRWWVRRSTRPDAGVFACGDAVSGPATVVEAVAQGNLVAVAVDHWLKTAEYEKPRYETARPDIAQYYNLDDYANAQRPHVPELALTERAGHASAKWSWALMSTPCARKRNAACAVTSNGWSS